MANLHNTRNTRTILLAGRSDMPDSQLQENILVGGGYTVVYVPFEQFAAHLSVSVDADLVVIPENCLTISSAETVRNLIQQIAGQDVAILLIGPTPELLALTQGVDCLMDCIRPPYDRDLLLMRVRLLLQLKRTTQELKSCHEQLLAAQKMECVGALAAGVAHEFNNLMCSVVGFAELARADGGQDIQALRDCADVSYEAAKRATATAASLLAFSRQIQNPRMLGNINEAIATSLRLLRRDMEKDNVVVDLRLGTIPETLIAMAPIQQVILNLVINAWQAMRNIQKERRLVITTMLDKGNRIIVMVEDTGPGIELDKQEKIFEPFYTTKLGTHGVQGTGLGLAVVREVVRNHRGEVWVESEPGDGARFTVALPVESTDSTIPTIPVDPDVSVPNRRRVLVVDDEEPNRKALVRLLVRHGHEAYAAANMAEAITLLWSHSVDLIVLDMVMPGTDGAQNVRLLRDDGISAPILLCTGIVDDDAINLAMSFGANGLLRKPFSTTDFLEGMDRCINPAPARIEPIG